MEARFGGELEQEGDEISRGNISPLMPFDQGSDRLGVAASHPFRMINASRELGLEPEKMSRTIGRPGPIIHTVDQAPAWLDP